MFFSAATEPGSRDIPNEDWVGVSTTAAVAIDGVTVFKNTQTGCFHGTPWYVNQLGTRLLALVSDPSISLRSALKAVISDVASLHASTCDLRQIGAPSAAVSVVRKNGGIVEYLVLADMTILIESGNGLTVISDVRVSATVEDLAGASESSQEIMKRRQRYRNKEGSYWVAAADPEAAEHARVGHVAADSVSRVALMSDGAARLVTPFQQVDWPEILTLASESGPGAVIERVRKIEESDSEKVRWPRFKVSDDATIAILEP